MLPSMLSLMQRAAEMESVATVVRISAHEKGGGAVGSGNTLDWEEADALMVREEEEEEKAEEGKGEEREGVEEDEIRNICGEKFEDY